VAKWLAKWSIFQAVCQHPRLDQRLETAHLDLNFRVREISISGVTNELMLRQAFKYSRILSLSSQKIKLIVNFVVLDHGFYILCTEIEGLCGE